MRKRADGIMKKYIYQIRDKSRKFVDLIKEKVDSLFICCTMMLVISLALIYYSSLKDGWEQGLWLNIGTGIICSLIFLWSVDFVINRKNKLDQKQRAELAFKRLEWPMKLYLDMFRDMYKASAKVDEFVKYSTIEEMFCEKFFETIQHLDIKSKAPIVGDYSWDSFINQNAKVFTSALDSVVDKYGTFMKKEDVELVESIINAKFIQLVKQVVAVQHNKVPFLVISIDVVEYIKLLMKLVSIMSKNLGESRDLNKVIFDDNTLPNVGENRMEFTVSPCPGRAEYYFNDN